MSPLLLSLAACGWNTLPDHGYSDLGPLWDPTDAVPVADGLYVRLLRSGGLVRLTPGRDEEVTAVDIGEGRVTRIDPSPDGGALVALIERYSCVTRDLPKSADAVDDCEVEDLETATELTVVRDARPSRGSALPGKYNTVRISEDGTFAIAWLDLSQVEAIDAVVNLTGVAVLDVRSGETVLVPVGFAPEHVLFAEDADGNATRAVVLSRNQVALLELVDGTPHRSVTFPLGLDEDDAIDPVEVDLTPDGRYAMVSTRGRTDLYVLDLSDPSINIVELASAPRAMAVSDVADATLLVYADSPTLQLVDHASFDVDSVSLEEGMDRILLDGERALLYGTGSQHDLYRYDLDSGDLTEYRLQNPATTLRVAPSGDFAVALTRRESSGGGGVDGFYDANPGMEIIDLHSDDTTPFLLEGQGVDLAFSGDQLILLQQDQDYLYRYDLVARQESTLRLSSPARRIGAMADGRFFVTHDDALGRVTFLDPANGGVHEVGGFASIGLSDPIELVQP